MSRESSPELAELASRILSDPDFVPTDAQIRSLAGSVLSQASDEDEEDEES